MNRPSFSVKQLRKQFDIIQSAENADINRPIASKLKRENKPPKSRSAMDTARDLVLEAYTTVSRRITRLEDGPNGVIQHEELMTNDERAMVFQHMYCSGRKLRSRTVIR